MKKILFLDDDLERISEFLSKMNKYDFDITTVETADECINKILSNYYDFVSLDHDLGGELFVNSDRIDTGMEVVRHIVHNKPAQGKFIVHSYNPVGAAGMYISLQTSGYEVFQLPFKSQEYYSKVYEILDIQRKIKHTTTNRTKQKSKNSFSDKIKNYIRYITKGK